MWLFMNKSFLSIVGKGDPSGKTLLVRAWPGQGQVANAIADAICNIDYSNFKSTVSDPDRHAAYLEFVQLCMPFRVAINDDLAAELSYRLETCQWKNLRRMGS